MALYDRYSRLLYRIAFHVVKDSGIAEDITQEVFIHIWQKAKCFSPQRGSLSTWLAVITRHRSIDALRKKKKETAITIEQVSHDSVHEQAVLAESMSELAVLLHSLSVPQQDVLRLAYVSGLSHSEISARIGEPLGTVKSRIRSTLQLLRKAISNRKMKLRSKSSHTRETQKIEVTSRTVLPITEVSCVIQNERSSAA